MVFDKDPDPPKKGASGGELLQGEQIKYRPDIDGLRALAVSTVVLFHAFPKYLPGGFVGVDVFFVISGFLISGIIFDQERNGTFRLVDFYARRARRIFPALLIVILTTAAVGWWILLPSEYDRLGQQITAGSLFVANFYFWLQAGYFSPDSRTVPLLHLWSLGVEEQFYIFWPLILIALRRRPNLAAYSIAAIATLSFCLCVWFADYREADFYSPATRAWELMVGAALAWINRKDLIPTRFADRTAESSVAIWLALIAGSCLLLHQDNAYPSWKAIFPTAGAVLVLWGGPKSVTASRPLTLPAIISLGLISYPLYLWHWPILVLCSRFKFATLTLVERGLAIGGSILLSWLTYRFIELSVRKWHLRSAKLLGLYVGVIFVSTIGLCIFLSDGMEQRFPPEIQKIAKLQTIGTSWRGHTCFLFTEGEKNFADECRESGARPLIYLWGDSTAAALMSGFRKLQEKRSFSLSQFTISACQPALAVDYLNSHNCRALNEKVLLLAAEDKPEIVVLHGAWKSDEVTASGLMRTIAALKRFSIPRIIVIGPDPVWPRGLPDEAMGYFMKHRHIIPTRYKGNVELAWDEERMRDQIKNAGAEYFSAWDAMCNLEGCLTRLGDRADDLVTSDAQHLSESGSQFLIDAAAEIIFEIKAQSIQPKNLKNR